jgi:hypothetical protein
MKVGLFVISLTSVVFAGKVDEVWNKTFDGSIEDEAYSVAIDQQGNVYLAGYSMNSTKDFTTVKYSDAGILQWNATYDSGYDDVGRGVAVNEGFTSYVYVTGYSHNGSNDDFLTIKYDLAGDTVWTRRYDTGADDIANAVVVDDDEYVYVAGYCYSASSASILIIKYDQGGDALWVRTYSASEYEVACGLELDSNYLYIAGYTNDGSGSDNDFRVLKYDKDGSLQWTRTYDTGDEEEGYRVTADDEGSVYITGRSYVAGMGDYLTIKYTKTGDTEWTKLYDGGGDDGGHGIGPRGNFIYVTGFSDNGGNKDFLMTKYNKNGNPVWIQSYDSGDDDIPYDLAVENDYIYVAGVYDNGTNTDFRIIKYREKEITLLEPNGEEDFFIGSICTITWESDGPIDLVVIEYSNEFTEGLDTIAIASNTGSYDWTVSGPTGYYTRVFVSDADNYSEVRDSSDAYFAIEESAVEERPPYSSGVLGLQVSIENTGAISIRYELSSPTNSSLKVYNCDGSLAHDLTPLVRKNKGEIFWDGRDAKNNKLPAGVYFIRLTNAGDVAHAKILLTE